MFMFISMSKSISDELYVLCMFMFISMSKSISDVYVAYEANKIFFFS